MTNQHYDLRLAIACYLDNESMIIPPYYHDHIVNAYNHNQLTWVVEQAAALTLFSAFRDNVLQLTDLSYPGQVALMWAENHTDDLKIQAINSSIEKKRYLGKFISP